MWPKIGPVPLYGTLSLIGLACHFIISWRAAQQLGLKRRWGVMVSICYVLGMIPGAKFLFHWHRVGFDPGVIFRLEAYRQGGLWGGLIVYIVLAGALALLAFRKRRAVLDLTALALPIPWALGKVGCLLNGCCNGRPSSLPWAISFPEGCSSSHIGVPVHPSQVYEIVLMIVLFMLFRALNNSAWRGTLLFWFISLYGVGRAATDVFRGDIDRYIFLGPVTLTQLFCLVSAALSLTLLFYMKPSTLSTGRQ